MFPVVRTIALVIAAAVCAPLTAGASVIYTYTGTQFTEIVLAGPTPPASRYTTDDRVTGFFELAAPVISSTLVEVTPLSFSFTDGINTVDQDNANVTYFAVVTDSAGHFTSWLVSVRMFLPGNEGRPNWHVSTNNFDNGTRRVANDVGSDTRCGPTSLTYSCAFFGDPYYYQAGSNTDAPGVWERTRVRVPEPTSLTLVGVALVGLVARRRVR